MLWHTHTCKSPCVSVVAHTLVDGGLTAALAMIHDTPLLSSSSSPHLLRADRSGASTCPLMVGLFLFDKLSVWAERDGDGWIWGHRGGMSQLESSIDVIPSRLSISYTSSGTYKYRGGVCIGRNPACFAAFSYYIERKRSLYMSSTHIYISVYTYTVSRVNYTVVYPMLRFCYIPASLISSHHKKNKNI